MFKETLSVAGELAGKLGSIRNQRDNRRVRIANFYEKLGTCLEKIVEALDSKQPLDDLIEELEIYVSSFSSAVGDIIGFKLTEQLVKSLRSDFDMESFNKLQSLSNGELVDAKKNLKMASDKFIDLWSALQ